MNASRTSMTARLFASLALLAATWVLPAPALAASHHHKAEAASSRHHAAAAKKAKAETTSKSGKAGKASKAGKSAKADSADQACTQKGKGRHKKTVCKPARAESAKAEASRTEKVCTKQGKGRHKKTVCKSVGMGAPESAKSEASRSEKVCTKQGKGRHKKTVCKTVEKSAPESARSAATRSERVCTKQGRGRHSKTVCRTVEKPVVERAEKPGKSDQVCSATVIRHGRKHRIRKPCAAPSEPLLTNSPIREGALEQPAKPAAPAAPVRARTAPIRAYAVDGSTFFHNGRKYRVEGLNQDAASGEHATQRLQQILDSGPVTIEPTSADENGAQRAVVKVGGRDVAELIRQKP